VCKKAFFNGGLIISLLLLVIFPALAEGVTTFLTEDFEGDFSGGAPSGWTKSYKAEPSIGRETSAIL
jgi:cytochrome bd-type quinol oxidase subunit 2